MSCLLPEDLVAALDHVVDDLLGEADVAQPPVCPMHVARRLGIPVVLDRRQQGRARQKRIDGRASIFVRPEPRPERLHWAVAHEIGEQAAFRVFGLVDLAPGQLPLRSREQVANQLAARLLMPTEWFAADARALGYELYGMKRRYTTASHESIAWRLLDLPEPSIVTVFDNGARTARRWNVPRRVPPLQEIELTCLRDVRSRRSRSRVHAGCLVATGWAVHEPGWQREILRTTIDAEGDPL